MLQNTRCNGHSSLLLLPRDLRSYQFAGHLTAEGWCPIHARWLLLSGGVWGLARGPKQERDQLLDIVWGGVRDEGVREIILATDLLCTVCAPRCVTDPEGFPVHVWDLRNACGLVRACHPAVRVRGYVFLFAGLALLDAVEIYRQGEIILPH